MDRAKERAKGGQASSSGSLERGVGFENTAADKVDFMSTNDVVKSHFCISSSARTAIMVVNMQGKFDLPIPDDHVGSYEAYLLLDEPNYRAPAVSTDSLQTGHKALKRSETQSNHLPAINMSIPNLL